MQIFSSSLLNNQYNPGLMPVLGENVCGKKFLDKSDILFAPPELSLWEPTGLEGGNQ